MSEIAHLYHALITYSKFLHLTLFPLVARIRILSPWHWCILSYKRERQKSLNIYYLKDIIANVLCLLSNLERSTMLKEKAEPKKKIGPPFLDFFEKLTFHDQTSRRQILGSSLQTRGPYRSLWWPQWIPRTPSSDCHLGSTVLGRVLPALLTALTFASCLPWRAMNSCPFRLPHHYYCNCYHLCWSCPSSDGDGVPWFLHLARCPHLLHHLWSSYHCYHLRFLPAWPPSCYSLSQWRYYLYMWDIKVRFWSIWRRNWLIDWWFVFDLSKENNSSPLISFYSGTFFKCILFLAQ